MVAGEPRTAVLGYYWFAPPGLVVPRGGTNETASDVGRALPADCLGSIADPALDSKPARE